ncbi:MAG: sugar phosphate isomerase/epimerase [Chryseolinea sp.]
MKATPRPHASQYKMGLQLFTINSIIGRDVPGTLKRVSAIGYQDTETYGYDPDKRTYYGMSIPDFKQALADSQLTTTSGHYDFAKHFAEPADDMKRFVDRCIEGASALGQKYITWPWLDPSSRSIEKFKELTGKLNAIGEQVNKAGLGFAYHNHDFEFIDHNGQIGYDIIMKETDPRLVKLQIDLYWVMHSSKRSPAELFSLQPGRFVMWHVKDMDKVSRDYTEMGNGSIDYTKILPDASRSGMQYYYIEQGGNFAINPMDSITKSATFFKKNLEKYLA